MNLHMTRSTSGASFALVAGVAACLLALAATPARAGADGSWKSGTEAFEKVCARCHLPGIGPELRGRKLPAAYVKLIARNGFRAMPAFPDSALDDATLDQIAELIGKSTLPAANPPSKKR